MYIVVGALGLQGEAARCRRHLLDEVEVDVVVLVGHDPLSSIRINTIYVNIS